MIWTFYEENYVHMEWIAGSIKLQQLFCWPCLLYDQNSCSLDNPWAITGVIDLTKLSRAIGTGTVNTHNKKSQRLCCEIDAFWTRQD